MDIQEIITTATNLIETAWLTYPRKDVFITMPHTEWNMLRSHLAKDRKLTCWCDYKREHFLFAGEACCAGAAWECGVVE